jgi:hypothetical protein
MMANPLVDTELYAEVAADTVEVRAIDSAITEVLAAAESFVEAKGRHHSEIATRRLIVAVDQYRKVSPKKKRGAGRNYISIPTGDGPVAIYWADSDQPNAIWRRQHGENVRGTVSATGAFVPERKASK